MRRSARLNDGITEIPRPLRKKGCKPTRKRRKASSSRTILSIESRTNNDIEIVESKKKPQVVPAVVVTPVPIRSSKRKRNVCSHVEYIELSEGEDDIFEREEEVLERWCYCRGVDDGSIMVECSGVDCEYRWFHGRCVHFRSTEEEWMCGACERFDGARCTQEVKKCIDNVVDQVAAPEERSCVGLAMADLVYAVHKEPSVKPFRLPDRMQHMALRETVRNCLAAIIATVAGESVVTRTTPSPLLTKKTRTESPILISDQGRELYPCPDFYADSYLDWFEDRQEAKDRSETNQAIARAREAMREKRFGSRKKKRKRLSSAIAVSPPLPTGPPVLGPDHMIDAFFDFAASREQMRQQKEAGAAWPWSSNPILSKFRFTNICREYDRVTRWLRLHWTKLYQNASPQIILLNCAIFRVFGTIAFAQQIGWTTHFSNIDVLTESLVQAATQVWYNGLHAFTRAYCRPRFNSEVLKEDTPRIEPPIKVYQQAASRIASLATALSTASLLPEEGETSTWQALASSLRSVKGFGGTGFVVKECMLDAMGWETFRTRIKDNNDWTLAGPGARRGLNRIHGRDINFGILAPARSDCESLFIQEISLLTREAATRHLNPPLPQLSIHDIQFILCEFDKYSRAQLRPACGLAKYLPLQGTRFDTPDGTPPSEISCRHPDFEVHSPLLATRLHAPSSPAARAPHSSDR